MSDRTALLVDDDQRGRIEANHQLRSLVEKVAREYDLQPADICLVLLDHFLVQERHVRKR